MQSFRILSVFVAVLLGAGLSSAQSLLVSQGQVLSFAGANGLPDGDVAPGLSLGERFGGASGPGAGVIDDSGRVLWRAQLVDAAGMAFPAAQNYLDRAYYIGDRRGNLTLVLRGGDPELTGTIPNATLGASGLGTPMTANPRIASNGLIMFGTKIWDAVGLTITSVDDSLLYVGTPGNWQILAREGSVAPNTGGATYSSDFGSSGYTNTSLNAAGQIVFQSSLAGTGVTTANNSAWFTGTPGNVQVFVRKGDIAPGLEVVSNIGPQAQMNASGQVVTDVTFAIGSGTTPVTTATDKALWVYTPGGPITEILREGNATPIPGTFYANLSQTAPLWFNAAGQALVGCPITGAVTAGVDDQAVFIASASGASVVLRRGDPAPGVPGSNFNLVSTFNSCFTDGGKVLFGSSLVGGGVTTANDSGLWTGTAGNLTLIAREGDVAPGSGGQTFGSMTGGSPILNAAGQVLFGNALSGTAPVQSFYSWDPVLGLQAVAFPNDSVEVQPGVFRTLTGQPAVPNSNGASRALAFANDGTATIRPTFSDGSFAIATVRIGSLTALPKKISNATGGTQKLFLQAGAAHNGQLYAVAGSASGTNPGTTIGAFTVPLNLDAYTDFTLAFANTGPYVNTFSNLNADGRALAQIVVPPMIGLTGVIVHHAYGVLDAFGNLVFASEAASLEVIP